MSAEEAARSTPTKGDRFEWAPGGTPSVDITVRRVARDLAWADIHCVDKSGYEWTKRQRLPLPVGCRLVTS